MAANVIELLNQAMLGSIAAEAVGDYPAALRLAGAAQGYLAVLPRVSRSTGAGQQSVQFDAEGIENHVKRLQQRYAASLGVQTANVQFNQPQALLDNFANPMGLTQ